VAKKKEAIGYFKQALECEDMWGYYETHICDLFYDMSGESIPDNRFGVGYDDSIKDDDGEDDAAGADYFDFLHGDSYDSNICSSLQLASST
jgi:hypothetical protein